MGCHNKLGSQPQREHLSNPPALVQERSNSSLMAVECHRGKHPAVARRTVDRQKDVVGAFNGNCVTQSNANMDLVQVHVHPVVDGLTTA